VTTTAPELDRVQGFLQEILRRDGELTESPDLAPRIAEHITGNDRLSPAEQADLYREQFFLRHVESLEEDHIGIAHYLGEEAFDAFARAYLRAHPPRTRSLRDLGADLATFAATYDGFPEGLRDLVVDMARYELLLVDVFDAADVPPPDGPRLAAIPEDVWLTRPLVWTPHLRLLALSYPAPELRIAAKKAAHEAAHEAHPGEAALALEHHAHLHAADGAPKAPPPREPAYYGIFRRDDIVAFERLTAEAHGLLELLTAGESLASGCEKLSSRLTDEEAAKVEAEVGAWFQRWASWGWILDVRAR